MLSLSAVAVYPINSMRRKFMQKSQYKNWKSAGYWRYLSWIMVLEYWMREYIAIMLNNEKLVASPARHSLISYTIEVMFVTWLVNGAEIDASACDKERPISACLRAPQSFAPSPHIDVFLPICWKTITILALSFGLVLAKTVTFYIKFRWISVMSFTAPENN